MPKEKIKTCLKHGNCTFILEGRGYYRCKKCRIERVILSRNNKKIKLVKYFGGKCSKCGYDKSYKALQFHHLDPNKKEFTISGLDCSFEKSLEEAKKCILVCANCHAEIEEELDNNGDHGVMEA